MDNIRFDINATDKSKPAFNSVRDSADKTAASVKQFDRNFGEMTGRILASAPAFAVATAAIAGVYGALRLVTSELTTGFNAVEEYRQSVIQMAAVMTNFSQKAKEGDIAGAWKEASAYAKVMVSDLEIIDAKSLASGQNIIDMTRTMLTYGVQINTNISSQRDALVTLSNAIAIATAGQQNANLQYVQEIRGLMEGVSKPGNVLVAILERAGVNVKEFAKDMQVGKKSVADLIPYLSGFMSASEEIEYSWTAIKSTLETTNKRVLRDAFLPIYRDILDSANDLKSVFMDQNGVLTKQAKILQNDIKSAWEGVAGIISAATVGVGEFSKAYQNLKSLYDTMPLSKLIDFGVGTVGKGMATYALRGGPLYYVNQILDQISEKANKTKAAKEELNDYIAALDDFYGSSSTPVSPPVPAVPPLSDEQKKTLTDAVDALRKTRDEWEKTRQSLSTKVALGGLTGLAKELKQLSIEHGETVAKFHGFDTSEIDRFYEELAGQARVQAIEKVDAALTDFFEDIVKYSQELADAQIAALDSFYTLTEDQEMERIDEMWRKRLERMEEITLDTTTNITVFWEEAQRGMQNASKIFFFDVMSGNFDDLGAKFEDLILDMLANWQAAQLQMALWGSNPSAAGGIGDGLISAAVNYFSPGYSQNAGVDAALTEFFNFANGGVMTGSGPLPLRRYAAGGIANSPQLAVYGEGSRPEAYVPLPDGRSIPVTMQGGSNPNVTVNVFNQGGDKKDVADTKIKFDPRGMVVDIFLRDMAENGPMKRSMTGGF